MSGNAPSEPVINAPDEPTGPVPEFTNASTFTITRGVPVDIQLTVNNGPAVFTGNLPTGLTLDSDTGEITGSTLHAAGDTSYTVYAENENGVEGFVLTFTILQPALPQFTSPSVVAYGFGYPFNYHATTDIYAEINVSGPLPAGLSYDSETNVISGVSQTTDFEVTLVAINAAGQVEMTVSKDTEAPTIPQNLTASEITSTSLKLSWDLSTDNLAVAGYMIYKDGQSFTYFGNNNIPYFTVNDLEPGSTAVWSIVARDSSSNSSDFSNEIEVTMLE